MRFSTLKPGQLSVAEIIGWKSHQKKKEGSPKNYIDQSEEILQTISFGGKANNTEE